MCILLNVDGQNNGRSAVITEPTERSGAVCEV